MTAGPRLIAARLRLAALLWAALALAAAVACPWLGLAPGLIAAADLAAPLAGAGPAGLLLAPQEWLAGRLPRVVFWLVLVPAGLPLRLPRLDPLRRIVGRRASYW